MPSIPEMMKAFHIVQRQAESIIKNAGADSLFEARVFKDLCFAARTAADLQKS